MTRLALRRGVVARVESTGPVTRVVVNCGDEERPAVAYVDLVGPVEVGDDVIVNVAALDLALGSGGFDVVHVNLTRGLTGEGTPGAHVMKLNYTSLQHAVEPLETPDVDARAVDARAVDARAVDPRAADARADPSAADPSLDLAPIAGAPVAVIALHAQLPCVAWAAAQHAPGARIGFVQTWGGALPGGLSDAVRELRERDLLTDHVTAGTSFGGERDAISLEGAIDAGFAQLGWDAAIVGPGPGILGSETDLGHGGMAALGSAHAALALGCRPIIVPRMSSGDPRPRHRGISHHTRTILRLLLAEVDVALPEGWSVERHRACVAAVDLDGYRGSALPGRTMGREIDQDELFFRAALAGGVVLAEGIDGFRAGRD